MELEDSPNTNQPATLHLFGKPLLDCLITQLSPKGLTLSTYEPLDYQSIREGDLAEIHVSSLVTSKLGALKIRASIESAATSTLRLSYINPQDSNVRQLVNWFGQPAAPDPAAPNSDNAIIRELSALTLKQIAHFFDTYLEQADIGLLNLAEGASNNDQQNKLFEVKSLFRQQGAKLKELTCDLLKSRINDNANATPTIEQKLKPAVYENMALIDLKEFEDWLSMETIVRRANDQYLRPLLCLEQRYGKLLNKEVKGDQLPVSVHNICYALQEAFKHYEIAPEMLPVVYRFFDETVVAQLDALYDMLNSKLKSYGILPNVESQILQERRRPLYPTNKSSSDSSDSNDSNNDDRGSEQGNVVAMHSHPGLFSAVKNILGLLGGGSTDETSTIPATDPVELINTLSSLQHDQTAVDAIAQGASLRDWLNTNDNMRLAGEAAELISLVESIFQNIGSYPQISNSLVTQMKRLEIPVAKAAMVDSDFFTNPEHPAKLLLNQFIELCLNSDMPNLALEKKFNSVISDITHNFEEDNDVFQRALVDVSSIAQQQGNAYERNTHRIAQTYEGRQQVHKAQEVVAREIQRRVSPPQAPEIIIDLLDNGWRELLKLTYIKNGPESEVWHESLATLDQLLMWITEKDNEDARNDSSMERNLEADSFADLIGQQLDDVFPGDYRHQSIVEKIRDSLKGQLPIAMVPLENESQTDPFRPNELLKELESANPELSRWFKRARSLHIGEEFSYLNDDTGQRNIKLAWVSENQQHFVFVNSRGQKVLDFDLVDLANELSKGLSPVKEKNEWPLVERSLYSTVQQAYEQLAFKSSHDELTGLISRKECERLLGDSLVDAKNNWQHHSLLYLDVDQFSLINTLHGHVAGDQLLVDLSQLIKDHSPENSVIARMAGNEFVILLQRRDISDSHKLAEDMCRTIENYEFTWQQHTIQFTASVGLIEINKYTENVIDLVRNAVSACSTAKSNGGNRVYDFRQDAELHNRREKLLSWIDRLNEVLTSDRLVLRGQEIRPLHDGEEHGHYEILLAIKDDEGNLDSPIEFIEAAECYNRMQRVDRWVVENTFEWVSQLIADTGSSPAVSINLSGNSINDDQFMDFILEQFAKYKVPTNIVCFEVTETATIASLAEAADFIREIKKIGCKFSLDDFGSGNASYQYLKHLPVDYLKIDGMFVQEIDKNKNDFALVKSINEIAHLMDKKTIAEYAETDAIVKKLDEIGVDFIQGYAISMPTLLSEIAEQRQSRT